MWERSSLMNLGSMICPAMFQNGVTTGLVIILLQVRKIQLDLLDICFLLVVVYIEEEVGMASEEIAV